MSGEDHPPADGDRIDPTGLDAADPDVRRATAIALADAAETDPDVAVTALRPLALAAEDPDRETRVVARAALATLHGAGDDARTDAVTAAVEDLAEPATRPGASAALRWLVLPHDTRPVVVDSLGTVLEHLDDDDPVVRRSVAIVCEQLVRAERRVDRLREPEVLEALDHALSDPDPRVRGHVLSVLSAVDRRPDGRVLAMAARLSDPDRGVRTTAVRWLRRAGHPDWTEVVAELPDETARTFRRRVAVGVDRCLDDPAANRRAAANELDAVTVLEHPAGTDFVGRLVATLDGADPEVRRCVADTLVDLAGRRPRLLFDHIEEVLDAAGPDRPAAIRVRDALPMGHLAAETTVLDER